MKNENAAWKLAGATAPFEVAGARLADLGGPLLRAAWRGELLRRELLF